MNSNFEGVYWNTGENEYTIQVSFPNNKKRYILEKFCDWSSVGEGKDSKHDRLIKIFRKKFQNHSELEVFIKDLKQKNNFSLKEV